jgi:hypothetical protein
MGTIVEVVTLARLAVLEPVTLGGEAVAIDFTLAWVSVLALGSLSSFKMMGSFA